jgi:hypothetical protein
MDVDWIILSELSVIEGASNKLTIVNIAESLGVRKLPLMLQKLCINMRLIGDPFERGELKVTLYGPQGNVLAEGTGTAVIGERGTVTTYVAAKPIRFSEAGMHEARISINGQPKKSASLDVVLL